MVSSFGFVLDEIPEEGHTRLLDFLFRDCKYALENLGQLPGIGLRHDIPPECVLWIASEP
jgi:hypothetical protein